MNDELWNCERTGNSKGRNEEIEREKMERIRDGRKREDANVVEFRERTNEIVREG